METGPASPPDGLAIMLLPVLPSMGRRSTLVSSTRTVVEHGGKGSRPRGLVLAVEVSLETTGGRQATVCIETGYSVGKKSRKCGKWMVNEA